MAIITTFPSARRKKLKRKEREGEEKKTKKEWKVVRTFPMKLVQNVACS